MSDERLREAYARALTTRAPAERAACPAPDAILALVRREGDEGARLLVLDHVMACAACHDEFELLRSIERAGRQAEKTEVADAGSAGGRVVGHIAWRRWAPLAAAAAIVMAVALGPGRRLWERAPEPVRGGTDPLALIAPEADFMPAGSPVTFAWHSVPGAEHYVIEVLDGGGAVAASGAAGSDTTMTLILPPTLPPGDYRWWVVARMGDGSETRSALRVLRLRGR